MLIHDGFSAQPTRPFFTHFEKQPPETSWKGPWLDGNQGSRPPHHRRELVSYMDLGQEATTFGLCSPSRGELTSGHLVASGKRRKRRFTDATKVESGGDTNFASRATWSGGSLHKGGRSKNPTSQREKNKIFYVFRDYLWRMARRESV